MFKIKTIISNWFHSAPSEEDPIIEQKTEGEKELVPESPPAHKQLIFDADDFDAISQLESINQLTLWRDKVVSRTEVHFRNKLPQLKGAIASHIDEAGFFAKRFKKDSIKEGIDRDFIEWLTTQTKVLIEEANEELAKISCVPKTIQSEDHDKSRMVGEIDVSKTNLDFIASGSAGVVGAGVLAVLPGLSTVSAGGIAGIFGATVISAPIAATGLAVGAAALGYSALSNDNGSEKLIESFTEHYRNLLFDSSEESNPICADLKNMFMDESNKMMEGLIND